MFPHTEKSFTSYIHYKCFHTRVVLSFACLRPGTLDPKQCVCENLIHLLDQCVQSAVVNVRQCFLMKQGGGGPIGHAMARLLLISNDSLSDMCCKFFLFYSLVIFLMLNSFLLCSPPRNNVLCVKLFCPQLAACHFFEITAMPVFFVCLFFKDGGHEESWKHSFAH